MPSEPSLYVALPVDLTVSVNPNKHTKAVCERFGSAPIELTRHVGAMLGPSEAKALERVMTDVRALVDSIIENNGGGLDRSDFHVRVWKQKVEDGRFASSPTGGTILSV